MDFTIIGAGASGTAMLLQLARSLEKNPSGAAGDPRGWCVRVVERQEVLGPGFPHSPANTLPCHLINMCARDMGIVDGHPEDFQAWLDEHREDLPAGFPEYRPYLEAPEYRQGPCTYVPRRIMGAYLAARFETSVSRLRRMGVRVELLSGWEVEDLREETEGIRMTLRRPGGTPTRELATERALLATGHWFDGAREDRFFPSPWPPQTLQSSIPPGARVGVIGTSLSALDTVLTLTADGRFVRRRDGDLVYEALEPSRTVTLFSRSGRLPRVRGRSGAYRNVHFTRENLRERRLANGGVLGLRDLHELLDRDLRRHYGAPVDWKEQVWPPGAPEALLAGHHREACDGDGPGGELRWQTVLHQTFSMAREIYLRLSPQDRMRFDRELNTPFFLFASPMPPVNAEKLLALMRAGVVRVIRLGTEYRLDRPSGETPFVFTYTDPFGRPRQERCGFLVDARGQKRSYETSPDPLARNLLASGTVHIETLPLPESRGDAHRTGGVWIDPGTQRVARTATGGSRRISSRLYAVGVPTRGQILDASMAYSCARAAGIVARDLLGL